MNIFAVRLKEALTAKNIKPSDLAKKTGIGKSSISDWLAGRYEAKQDKVYRIADALDINEAWLMGQEVPMEKNASTIDRIYKKLEPQRQAIVYQFAEQQLHEEIEKIHDYLDEIDAKYQQSISSDKKED